MLGDKSDRQDALKLARQLLDDLHADPDDALRLLARQLLRGQEIIDRLKRDLNAQLDPTLDLIHANRDEILKKHEEAVRKISRLLERGLASDASTHQTLQSIRMSLAVLDALKRFHPMHPESWPDWPEEWVTPPGSPGTPAS